MTTDKVSENECITISMKQEIRAEKKTGTKNIGIERRRTNSVEMSLYWEADSSWSSREIRHILWSPKVHCHVRNSLALLPVLSKINRLTPNDPYMCRTAPLTSKRCILYIYSTSIGTEYFKHALHSPFLSLQNAVCFIMLTCLVPVLFTFYIQGVLK